MAAQTTHTRLILFSGNEEEDRRRFVDIYHHYWEKLFAIAYNRIRSQQAAEDVVQEVMISLWRRRSEVRIKDLDSWLAAATRYSVLRQLSRYGDRIVSLDASNSPAIQPDFDFRFLQQMLREQVHRLPERCRLVFSYSRELGMTNKQISDELGVSEKAVEKQMTRALSSLRNLTKIFLSLVVGLVLHFGTLQ